MTENQQLLEKLETLLKWKKSKAYYAEKLGVSLETVEELLKELKREESTNNGGIFVEKIETEHTTGNQKIVIESNKPLSPKEIEELVGVDNISTFVDRSWLKSHKNGTWTYSVLTITKIKDFYNVEELESKLKALFSQEKNLEIKSLPIQEKALFIYIADDHAGLILKNSLYEKEYNGFVYTGRLIEIIKQIEALDKGFEQVYVIRLGDELDGFNGKTTRYDHDLGSASNKEQFDVYTSSNKLFYEKLFSSGIGNEYKIVNILNSNHSGKGFSYIANKALEFWIEARFSNVEIIYQEKFIASYFYGNHVINLTHGKDEQYMKSPMPLNLDFKTDLWLMEFNKKNILEGSFVSTIKGDIHKFNINQGKSGRYVNVPSICGGSSWIEHNFGDNEAGALLEIYPKYSKNIQTIPIWF